MAVPADGPSTAAHEAAACAAAAPDEAAVRAAAAQLGLDIPSACLPGVLRFHALASQMAEQVMGLPLTPADESGSVFRPVEPTGEGR